MQKKEELQQLRSQIDEIDEALVKLLNERALVTLALMRAKPDATPESEITFIQSVLAHITDCNDGPLDDETMQLLFRQILVTVSQALEAVTNQPTADATLPELQAVA